MGVDSESLPVTPRLAEDARCREVWYLGFYTVSRDGVSKSAKKDSVIKRFF